jgi:hypothetical protein
MDDKKLSKEIINSLNYQSSHTNVKCNIAKQNFVNICEYKKNHKYPHITLETLYKNTNCIKLYNDYYDCYKNDKLS